ncbi:MAG TPA: hypothetical protein VII06_01385 [Chloroflexota bacterium]|jgi:hypothetical protein
MGDIAYRLLGVLVQARFQIAALVAVANAVLLLLEVHVLLEAPTPNGGAGLFDTPLLLTAAVLLIAQLPPGVVFRLTRAAPTRGDAAADGEAVPDASQWGCRASARFREGVGQEWRLLAPSTLQVTPWGGVEVSAPTYAPRPRRHTVAPIGVRTLDWYRPRLGVHPSVWGADPTGVQRRGGRREPEVIVQSIARLAIPAPTLEAVEAGWQYAGLRRYPALRLRHRGDSPRPQFTYLAFGSRAARDAVRARLAG